MASQSFNPALFPGPPFLQYGVPGPQRALFCGNPRSRAGKIVLSMETQYGPQYSSLVRVIPLRLAVAWCLWRADRNVKDIISAEIFWCTSQGARSKIERGTQIFTGTRNFLPFPLP